MYSSKAHPNVRTTNKQDRARNPASPATPQVRPPFFSLFLPSFFVPDHGIPAHPHPHTRDDERAGPRATRQWVRQAHANRTAVEEAVRYALFLSFWIDHLFSAQTTASRNGCDPTMCKHERARTGHDPTVHEGEQPPNDLFGFRGQRERERQLIVSQLLA